MSDSGNQALGGLFHGQDGKLSGRRILGTISILGGLALEAAAQFQEGDILQRLLPGAICLLAGMIMWGLVSWQNIQDAAKAIKGGGQ